MGEPAITKREIFVALALVSSVGVAALLPAADASGQSRDATTSWKLAKRRHVAQATSLALSGIPLTAPKAIGVKIVTTPQRPTSIHWLVACRSPSGSSSSRGTVRTSNPRVTTLRMPAANPRSCLVQVSASVRRSSNMTLSVLYR